jgi:hypothetical protein
MHPPARATLARLAHPSEDEWWIIWRVGDLRAERDRITLPDALGPQPTVEQVIAHVEQAIVGLGISPTLRDPHKDSASPAFPAAWDLT